MKISKFVGSIALATTLSLAAFATEPEASSVYSDYDRISGSDRYSTSVQVSKKGWAYNSTNTVVLAVGNNYPDALSGVPLAKKYNAPILLVKKDGVPSAVLSEIKRVGAEKAFVLGGTGAISNAVITQLKNAGITAERVAGKDRHETSALIAKKVGGTSAVVASGSSFPDSLAIASYAAERGMPILLTTPSKMMPSVETEVKKYANVTVVGGEGAVSKAVYTKIDQTATVKRVAGKDRYETAAKIVTDLYPATVSSALVASGQEFADALTGSAYGAKTKKPVLLVKKTALPAATKSAISAKNVSSLTVVGGQAAVSNEALSPTQTAIAPSSTALRNAIVEESKKYIGIKYLYGGETTAGFDCSGYIQYVYKQEGQTVPRTTSQMANFGTAVSYANAKPGDVIILDLKNSKPTTPTHAGIYLGNGQFIHASYSRGIVIQAVSLLDWDQKIVSVRSFIK